VRTGKVVMTKQRYRWSVGKWSGDIQTGSGIQIFRGQRYRLVTDVWISNWTMDKGSRANPTEV
jgi:hypothetical protein